MESIRTLQNCYQTPSTLKLNTNTHNFLFPGYPITKTLLCFRLSAQLHAISQDKHKTLLVESYHQHQTLKALLLRLKNKGSCPLQMLHDDGDWPTNHFWTVIRFLRHLFQSQKIFELFNMWKDIDKSRINEFNYEKIIETLSEEGLMEDAYSAFMEMRTFYLSPSLEVYNSLIRGYSRNGMFDDALVYLNQMKEVNLSPQTDTYDGLIQAYGKYKMYDEIGTCLKRMEMDGCSPTHVTYNLLIQEFAKAGLLTRMERVYQSTRMKRIDLKSSTLIRMLEAYAKFGIVEKMEMILKSVRNSKALLREDLIRKIAAVYIKNFMFSRLENLGRLICRISDKTDIVWCLLLLSNACMLSQRGMDSVVRQMEEAKVSWKITFVNIILLAYLKIKDLTRLQNLLSTLTNGAVKPDMVTVGVLFDANNIGFQQNETLDKWRRTGILYRCAEMETDPLVIAAFGKGQFIRKCENAFSSLEPIAREKQWTYCDLIDLVVKYNGNQLQLADE